MLSPALNLTLPRTSLTKLCKVYPSSLCTYIFHFLVPVVEEQDSPSLAPSGNQKGIACNHTNTPIQLRAHIGNVRSLHFDTNSPNQRPTHPVIEEQTPTTDQTDTATHDEPKGNDTDLLYRIHGLYRLLDLTSGQGSGGAGMISVSIVLHY